MNDLDNKREAFEERAAIKEFDAGIPRKQAEKEALAESNIFTCLACYPRLCRCEGRNLECER